MHISWTDDTFSHQIFFSLFFFPRKFFQLFPILSRTWNSCFYLLSPNLIRFYPLAKKYPEFFKFYLRVYVIVSSKEPNNFTGHSVKIIVQIFFKNSRYFIELDYNTQFTVLEFSKSWNFLPSCILCDLCALFLFFVWKMFQILNPNMRAILGYLCTTELYRFIS